MDFPPIQSVRDLSDRQKAALSRGGFKDVADVVLTTPSDLSRACRVPPQEADRVIALICREHARPLRSLTDILSEAPEERFTTGDADLDSVLGGGIKTGMIWEAVGESAAGKTQLALQLSLFVQLPPNLGGISGGTCYITVASHLQTARLEQIRNTHPMLTPSTCSLSDIQTVQTPTVEKLVYVLSTVLPRHIATPPANPSSKPLKLVIIDALAELFHTSVKTTTQTLVERSRRIFHISMLLHWLASRHRIAILVLNEVTDVFACDEPPDCSAISYRDQARWFNRAGNIPEEGKKEAALGLAWANQVNARIFLTRTGRRRYLDNEHDEPTVIRRLSVVFSSVSPPASCDYIVTSKGISVIPHSITLSTTPHQALVRSPCVSDSRTSDCSNVAGKVEQSPLDGDELASAAEVPAIEDEYDDEWESFWEANSLPDDVFTQT